MVDKRNERSSREPQKTDRVALESKEIVKELMDQVHARLQDSALKGEWSSWSGNITSGPGEAPVLNTFYLAATSKDNAIKIQNAFIQGAKDLNNVE